MTFGSAFVVTFAAVWGRKRERGGQEMKRENQDFVVSSKGNGFFLLAHV